MAWERADKMPIEHAHRLHKSAGRPAGTARNVLVKLSFWKDKYTILSCARRLKPEHMFFLEDFSDSVKTARAKLKDLLDKARQLELKSYLSCMCMMTVVIVWKLCERRLRMDCWMRTRLTLRMVQMMDPMKRLLALRTQTHNGRVRSICSWNIDGHLFIENKAAIVNMINQNDITVIYETWDVNG